MVIPIVYNDICLAQVNGVFWNVNEEVIEALVKLRIIAYCTFSLARNEKEQHIVEWMMIQISKSNSPFPSMLLYSGVT